MSEPFTLESGEVLPELKQRFCIFGNLNERRDNAVLVFHALTGTANVAEWWTGIIGADKALDTNVNAFICANYIGSCYGSTREIKTLITTRDVVRAQLKLLEHLKISRLKFIIGGSVGGQLVLQAAHDFPDLAEKFIAIGACELTAMGLALNHLQREAIKQTGNVNLARQIAMLTYKSEELLNENFARKPNRTGENPFAKIENRFDVAGYLDYQGTKFEQRFDAAAYNLISKMMDLFEIKNAFDNVGSIDNAAEIYLIGISTDWLFPAANVKRLAQRIGAIYVEMMSPDGHDAFLSDTAQTAEIIKKILNQNSRN